MCMARAFGGRGAPPRQIVRPVPFVLGLGLLSWSLGDVVLAITGTGSSSATPVPADVLYIAFYPITYVALLMFMRRQVRRFSVEMWLDGAIAGLGAAALCAAFVFNGVLRATGGSGATVATNLAYPVGDLLLLALVVGGSAVLPGRRKLPWLLLAVGYAINAVGDTFNLFGSGIGSTHFGTAANAVAWPISILLVSGAVWIRARPAAPLSREPATSFFLPGLAAIAALPILFAGSFEQLSPAALTLAVLTLAAAGLRFSLSLTSLRTLTAERHTQAVTDQLTTLANRRALFELLDALTDEQEEDDEEPRSLAFLFVDLNRFKEVNDSFGHSVGDELLTQLGARLKGALRDTDLLVRLGGDEFAVALLDADADYGALVAQRISSRLEEPFQLGAVRSRIGASIGIAERPGDASDAADLLRCADMAMYRAKVEGKPFAIYNRDVDGAGNRMGLVEDLREAIEQRRLELVYQPQISVETGEVVALEALLRWMHPQLGDVPPLEFLPLAEEAELMDALTALVLDLALEQCARWRREDHPVSVCVNLSTTNLLNPDFPQSVQAALDRHGLSPEALVLEITETTAITDFNRSKRTIEELRDLGLVVSVDDFGAGFTSLAYLSSLAVGELKLDRSFIQGIAAMNDERNLALVRSTIELAHALGLRVVAEGVEDQASYDLLVGLGCDLVQGYLISKPRLASEVGLHPYEPASKRRAARKRREAGDRAVRRLSA